MPRATAQDIDNDVEREFNVTEYDKETTDTEESSNDSGLDNTDTSNTANATVDPDIAALHAMSDDDQLWYFIDDVVPTDTKDTEVIICEDGITDSGFPMLTLGAKSMEIFEEIANIPNHAVGMYPNMVKYFSDIIRLYNDVVRQDINPYWAAEAIQPATPQIVQMLIGIQTGGCRGFLSRTPKKNSVPFRLYYGDNSHKHDFVGIVYLYVV